MNSRCHEFDRLFLYKLISMHCFQFGKKQVAIFSMVLLALDWVIGKLRILNWSGDNEASILNLVPEDKISKKHLFGIYNYAKWNF